MDNILSIRNLRKRFSENDVLKGIDLDVKRGECICILGRSGCGKSVLMKIITGLLCPDEGSVELNGEIVDFTSKLFLKNYRKKFGLVFQNAALFDYMNVYDNIALGLKHNFDYSKKEIDKIINDVLEELSLSDSIYRFPAELSGGMRKRVSLARALVLNPEILIYDEPTTGLDAVMVRNIDKIIKETQIKRKTTSIVISHDVSSTYRIADRIAIHSGGKIFETGDVESIKNSKEKVTQEILTGIVNE